MFLRSTERAADLASDLKDSLCEALPVAGSIARRARRFRMVDRAADTSNRDENHDVPCREGKAHQSDKGGCNNDPAIWKVKVIIPICTKSSAYFSLMIG
jgi:hypothetical protein